MQTGTAISFFICLDALYDGNEILRQLAGPAANDQVTNARIESIRIKREARQVEIERSNILLTERVSSAEAEK